MKLNVWFPIIAAKQLRLLSLWLGSVMLLAGFSTVQAEIYKCTINGHTVFSDQPCAENAETIDVKVHKPSAAEVEQQQALTKTYNEEARVQSLKSLRSENQRLQDDILRLDKQRTAELRRLSENIYRLDDKTIATKEHGLFQKMNAVAAQYQQQIEQIQNQIKQNESQINKLRLAAPNAN